MSNHNQNFPTGNSGKSGMGNFKVASMVVGILLVLLIAALAVINGATNKTSDLTTNDNGVIGQNRGLSTPNSGVTTQNTGASTKTTGVSTKADGLQILKSQVTSAAKFYPYTVNGVKMEVFAVKATDGTIRTAFNTCQICYNSGRGYYTQQGDEMICTNCGNRFWINNIEKIKNGCNPIPITAENKKDDGKYITIAKDFLASYSMYFKNWKR